MMRFVIVGNDVHPYDSKLKGQIVTVFPIREPKLNEGDRLFFIENQSRKLGIFRVKQKTDRGYMIRNEENPKLELKIPSQFKDEYRTTKMPLYLVI